MSSSVHAWYTCMVVYQKSDMYDTGDPSNLCSRARMCRSFPGIWVLKDVILCQYAFQETPKFSC